MLPSRAQGFNRKLLRLSHLQGKALAFVENLYQRRFQSEFKNCSPVYRGPDTHALLGRNAVTMWEKSTWNVGAGFAIGQIGLSYKI